MWHSFSWRWNPRGCLPSTFRNGKKLEWLFFVRFSPDLETVDPKTMMQGWQAASTWWCGMRFFCFYFPFVFTVHPFVFTVHECYSYRVLWYQHSWKEYMLIIMVDPQGGYHLVDMFVNIGLYIYIGNLM